MKAAILSFGDELVLGQIEERNARWLSRRLVDEGVSVTEHRTVADDLEAIVAALAALSKDCDIVISTGGLGPTDDDLLREALSRVLGDGELVEDAESRRRIEALFRGRGRVMPQINLRQAMRPRSAACLENEHGTAPGLVVARLHCRIWCLPGPPSEMQPMFERFVVPALFRDRERPRLLIDAIPVFGLGESTVAERLGDLMHRERNPLVGTTASGSVVTVRLRAHGKAAQDQPSFDALAQDVLRRVSPYGLGRGGPSLAGALARACVASDATVALAESCTAGLASSMLCAEEGASSWYRGGVVCYSNESKVSMLGVDAATIERFGAVSAETSQEMALGAASRFGAGTAASVTGIAGPSGGSNEKPVGTVFISTLQLTPGGIETTVRHFVFPGNREAIRDRAAKAAIGALRLHLLREADTPLLWERSRRTFSGLRL